MVCHVTMSLMLLLLSGDGHHHNLHDNDIVDGEEEDEPADCQAGDLSHCHHLHLWAIQGVFVVAGLNPVLAGFFLKNWFCTYM